MLEFGFIFFYSRDKVNGLVIDVFRVAAPFSNCSRTLYRIDRGKLSQWLYWENNLLERSTGRILDVSVNANSFCIQCSVVATAALARDRVLHYLPRQVKLYSLSFHVIDIKRLFQCNKLLYYFEKCNFIEYVC